MFIFQVHHYIKPEMIEAYRAATLENARLTIQEPGVLRFDVLQDQEDPAHFSLFEVYRDDQARADHLETAHFKAWKEVALQSFDRRGSGNRFTAYFPEESAWVKPPLAPKPATVEELQQAFLAEMQNTALRYTPFIQLAEAGGYLPVANLIRAVVASEKARSQLYSKGIAHHAGDAMDLYVCPHCGLVFAGEAPDCCPVDDTAAANFEVIR